MNYRIRENSLEHKQAAFTLVELIIVTAILGILAAIVLPEFQGHVQQAKEATAKDNLRILRESIERYAADHNGIPPGYTADNPAGTPSGVWFASQMENGYLSEVPENPFNNSKLVAVYQNAQTLPDTQIAGAGGGPGWLYHPASKKIILNTTEYMDY